MFSLDAIANCYLPKSWQAMFRYAPWHSPCGAEQKAQRCCSSVVNVVWDLERHNDLARSRDEFPGVPLRVLFAGKALFEIPEFSARGGDQEKKAPSTIKFFGLFFRFVSSDFLVSLRGAIRFGMGFPPFLLAFCLLKGPKNLRIFPYYDGSCRTTNKKEKA